MVGRSRIGRVRVAGHVVSNGEGGRVPGLSLLGCLLGVLSVGGDRVRRVGVRDEGLVLVHNNGELRPALILLLLSLLFVVLSRSLLLLEVLLEGLGPRSSV